MSMCRVLTCTDLDQLNHILNVVGSPSQEDLDCIVNEKVVCQCRHHVLYIDSAVLFTLGQVLPSGPSFQTHPAVEQTVP